MILHTRDVNFVVTQATTYAVPESKPTAKQELQWWIILVAALGGIILLIIVIVILYKVSTSKSTSPSISP